MPQPGADTRQALPAIFVVVTRGERAAVEALPHRVKRQLLNRLRQTLLKELRRVAHYRPARGVPGVRRGEQARSAVMPRGPDLEAEPAGCAVAGGTQHVLRTAGADAAGRDPPAGGDERFELTELGEEALTEAKS